MIDGKVKALISKWDGRPLDLDSFPNYQPYQCFDLWVQYMRDVVPGFNYLTLRPTGYAKDLWNNFDGLGLGQWLEKVQGEPEYGDIAVWRNAPFTPDSHVAIFLSKNGHNSINVFEQNAPLPLCAIGYITTNGLLGYLRFKNGDDMGRVSSIDEYKDVNVAMTHYPRNTISDEEAAGWVGGEYSQLARITLDPNTPRGQDWHRDNGILLDLYPQAVKALKDAQVDIADLRKQMAAMPQDTSEAERKLKALSAALKDALEIKG
ncbi:CHAP domain-containing protein [Nocardia sp. NPDC055165]